MEHTAISPEEAAGRLAIRELVDAYAHCADRRDAEGQKALFTENTGRASIGSEPFSSPPRHGAVVDRAEASGDGRTPRVPTFHPPGGETVSSTAMLGLISTVITPCLFGT
jgi:hypothetical protein